MKETKNGRRIRTSRKQATNGNGTAHLNGNGLSKDPAEKSSSSFDFSHWPTISVVIPLHGGEEEFGNCVKSLSKIRDLLDKVVVVDNASPYAALSKLDAYELPLIVLRNEENLGFGAACNQGIAASNGHVVLLLNSDTFVTRAGLVELIKALMSSGTIAAAGPYTNNSAHFQRIPVTYTSLETVELFAEDLAARNAQNRDVDMLVGFCIAIRRSVLNELGSKVFDERFGLGTWEDNDLCHRLRREGYRLVIASNAFIHHEGSKTIVRMNADFNGLMATNQRLYLKKWQRDLETGFASHLCGTSGEPVMFDPAKKPEVFFAECAKRAERAEISCCMIVRDEEDKIAECLNSIRPFVSELIVVDTGSKDRTREIAESCGAQVFDFPWTKSFSEARNESLKHATGKWILWIDADDVVPIQSGMDIQANATTAPKHIGGFVIPVRFTEDGPSGGVQVDHVKLFRNLPSLRFRHRIHEQILGSIREQGLEIARSRAVVLHSNYDTSDAGQEKKRNRDRELLNLDLKENPGHPFVLFNLGMTAHYQNRHVQAIKWLRKSIQAAVADESHVRKAYDLWAISLREMGRKQESLIVLRKGLDLYPDDPELNFQMAKAEAQIAEAIRAAERESSEKRQGKDSAGDLELGKDSRPKTQDSEAREHLLRARAHYDKVLAGDTMSFFSSVDQGIFGFKTLHNRAEVDFQLGDYESAKAGWMTALDKAPGFIASVLCLFEAALAVQDFRTAKAMHDQVLQQQDYSQMWSQMTMRFGESVLGEGFAFELLRQAFDSNPHFFEPRLEYCRRLLNTGRESEAFHHLLFLQERGCAEAAHYLGVSRVQVGDLKAARNWFVRAQALNPDHQQTVESLTKVEEALACQP